jgi:hypothetical protein
MVFSVGEKLITYVSVRISPNRIGESNILAVQTWKLLGLEAGTFLFIAVSIASVYILKKVADVFSKVEKLCVVALIFIAVLYVYHFVSNLVIFISEI